MDTSLTALKQLYPTVDDLREMIFSQDDPEGLLRLMNFPAPNSTDSIIGNRNRQVNFTALGKGAQYSYTVEFRQARGTLNPDDVMLWLDVCIGLMRLAQYYAEDHDARFPVEQWDIERDLVEPYGETPRRSIVSIWTLLKALGMSEMTLEYWRRREAFYATREGEDEFSRTDNEGDEGGPPLPHTMTSSLINKPGLLIKPTSPKARDLLPENSASSFIKKPTTILSPPKSPENEVVPDFHFSEWEIDDNTPVSSPTVNDNAAYAIFYSLLRQHGGYVTTLESVLQHLDIATGRREISHSTRNVEDAVSLLSVQEGDIFRAVIVQKNSANTGFEATRERSKIPRRDVYLFKDVSVKQLKDGEAKEWKALIPLQKKKIASTPSAAHAKTTQNEDVDVSHLEDDELTETGDESPPIDLEKSASSTVVGKRKPSFAMSNSNIASPKKIKLGAAEENPSDSVTFPDKRLCAASIGASLLSPKKVKVGATEEEVLDFNFHDWVVLEPPPTDVGAYSNVGAVNAILDSVKYQHPSHRFKDVNLTITLVDTGNMTSSPRPYARHVVMPAVAKGTKGKMYAVVAAANGLGAYTAFKLNRSKGVPLYLFYDTHSQPSLAWRGMKRRPVGLTNDEHHQEEVFVPRDANKNELEQNIPQSVDSPTSHTFVHPINVDAGNRLGVAPRFFDYFTAEAENQLIYQASGELAAEEMVFDNHSWCVMRFNINDWIIEDTEPSMTVEYPPGQIQWYPYLCGMRSLAQSMAAQYPNWYRKNYRDPNDLARLYLEKVNPEDWDGQDDLDLQKVLDIWSNQGGTRIFSLVVVKPNNQLSCKKIGKDGELEEQEDSKLKYGARRVGPIAEQEERRRNLYLHHETIHRSPAMGQNSAWGHWSSMRARPGMPKPLAGSDLASTSTKNKKDGKI
jgi:hypothetical protein